MKLGKEASSPFLQKRTKKLLFVGDLFQRGLMVPLGSEMAIIAGMAAG